MPIVPGIGYAGLGQQNPANQLVFRKGMGGRSGNGTRKRRTKKRAVKASGRRRSTKRANGKRLVKGSAAAKRRMAKIRKMRRK